VLVHGAIALIWTVSAVPAWLWWRDSVLFVIAASIFANVYAAVSALEAADDSAVREDLAEVKAMLRELLDPEPE
jgi:hypothetical protein